MKNLFIANGLFQLLSLILILFSPIYYTFQNLNAVYKIILMLNPTTHLLNIIRIPLGFSPIVNIGYSYIYILLLTALAMAYIMKHIQNAYILEKIM
jgi:ABC-2 type transport system permease protein